MYTVCTVVMEEKSFSPAVKLKLPLKFPIFLISVIPASKTKTSKILRKQHGLVQYGCRTLYLYLIALWVIYINLFVLPTHHLHGYHRSSRWRMHFRHYPDFWSFIIRNHFILVHFKSVFNLYSFATNITLKPFITFVRYFSTANDVPKFFHRVFVESYN